MNKVFDSISINNCVSQSESISSVSSLKRPNVFKELPPKGREILRSGKGRQVPCRNWTDSSLHLALKGRDCAEMPVQQAPKPSASLRRRKALDRMILCLQPNLAQLGAKEVCKVDFRNRNVKAEQAKVTFSQGNLRILNAMALCDPDSFIEIEIDNFKNQSSKKSILELTHTRMVEASHGDYELGVDIIVNGKTAVQGYLPPSKAQFAQETFDLTPFLKEGKNRIRIELGRCDGAGYALRELSLKMV